MESMDQMLGYLEIVEAKRSLLRQIDAGLRSGIFDYALVRFIQPFQRDLESESGFNMLNFLRFALRRVVNASHGDIADVPMTNGYPNRKIIELLGQLGLEQQVATYASRFPLTHPEAMARACEYLQMSEFDSGMCMSLGKCRKYQTWDKLNMFRLAQKIRNEHGITPRHSPPDAFRSFDDIIDLERKNMQNDHFDFMMQCFLLKIADLRHRDLMYMSIMSFPKLQRFHNAVLQRGAWQWRREEDELSPHRAHFEYLVKKLKKRPTLRELKNFLRTVNVIEMNDLQMLRELAKKHQLNELLNCFLNNLVRTSSRCDPAFVRAYLTGGIRSFLEEGATLHFRAPGEKLTSLGALVKFANSWLDEFPLLDLEKYFCCYMKHDGMKFTFDDCRVSPQTCLAARAIKELPPCGSVPKVLRCIIREHQELRSAVEGGECAPPTNCFVQWLLDFSDVDEEEDPIEEVLY